MTMLTFIEYGLGVIICLFQLGSAPPPMIERIAFEPLRQVAAPWRMYGQVYDEVSNLSPDEGGSVAKKHQPWKTT